MPADTQVADRPRPSGPAGVAAALGYGWRASRAATAAVLLFPLILAGMSLLQTVVNGLLVGAVPAALDAGAGSAAAGRVRELLVVVAAVLVGSTVLSQLSALLTGYVGPRFALTVRRAVIGAVNAPAGIAHLEDPEVADETADILAPERDWVWRSAVDFAQTVLLFGAEGAAYVILLGSFRWWLPLVIVPAWVLDWRNATGYLAGSAVGGQASAPGLRRARYLKQLATGPAAAKEVRAFGLATWAVGRFRRQWGEAMHPVWASNRRSLPLLYQASAAKVLAGAVVFAVLADAARGGRLSLSQLAIYAPAAFSLLQLGYLGDATAYLAETVRQSGRARALERRLAPAGPAPASASAEGLPRTEIRFEAVSFCYPGTSQRIIDRLDLRIEAGRSLAVVGDNGAGKTTLIKLLCRLYEPTEGRILVDGVPLSALDVQAWRSRLGVIFQDFVRWELPLRDNLLFAGPGADEDPQVLAGALADAGAEDLLADRPDRWGTVLSRAYDGGTDLSGGQWQKVALARALVAVRRGAGLLVLDEPTASLDVRAEAAVFDRLLSVARGVTTVLISHRFNTVRRAERIVVLAAGRVVEEGTHADLLAAGGRYARMYRLQADRFLDRPAADPTGSPADG